MSRLVVLGLDGGDWAVLDELGARGELPVLSRLASTGVRAVLRSTLPPVTLPAWSSFLCGAEPAEHGVIDMMVRRAGTRELVPATSALRRLPTFLETLAARGLVVASLGVPGTYPPLTALDLCIAGFDAPGASHARRDAVHPPAAFAEVQALGGWRYAAFNEQRGGSGRLAGIAPALVSDLEAKERIALWALASRPWDVFFLHVQAGDTAGHHLWHTYDYRSPRSRDAALRDALPSVYRRIDALAGRVIEAAGPSARVLVVSDHGMGGASDVAVHVNRVLHELGLLRFTEGSRHALAGVVGRATRAATGALTPELLGLALRLAPAALTAHLVRLARASAVDLARSAAFSDELDYGPSVWLSRRGIFPDGRVDATEAPRLLARIREALLRLEHPDTGEPLVAAVHPGAEALAAATRGAAPAADGGTSGRAAPALVPDLIVEPAWPGGYRPSFLASPGPGPAVRRLADAELSAARGHGMPGVHRREGVLLASGPGLDPAAAPELSLAEAGALVYPLVGIPDPLGILRGFWRELAVRLAGDSTGHAGPRRHCVIASPQTPRPLPAAVADLLVEQRLRDLGYLD